MANTLTNSMTKVTRQAKLNRSIGAEAFKMAKENNDVLYKKATKYKKLWKTFVQKIQDKYKARAKATVMTK